MRITEFLNLQFCCRALNLLLAISTAVFSFSPRTQAQTETVIHSFSDGATDGGFPGYGLSFDTAGNLWGTAGSGGPGGVGEVFQLVPTSVEAGPTTRSSASPNGPLADSLPRPSFSTLSGTPMARQCSEETVEAVVRAISAATYSSFLPVRTAGSKQSSTASQAEPTAENPRGIL